MFVLLLFLLFADLSPAQDSNIEKYQFISPLPGSKLIMPENNIIIRQGDLIDRSTLDNYKVMVIGSRSGIHPGNLILSPDLKTLIFKPHSPFMLGEEVTVKLKNGILTYSEIELAPVEFTFIITEHVISGNHKILCDEFFESNNSRNSYMKNYQNYNSTNKIPESSLNFPDITISISNNPSPGYIFMSPHSWSGTTAYLMIIDNNGIPIYYQRNSSINYDFKKQYNGLLTYWDQIPKKFFEMDSTYSIVDSFKCGNGYQTDLHELLVFPNGHSFLMSYDHQIVRMDTIVQGGDSAASVTGLIIQELDEMKNVIFQWRSWDHFKITDATDDIDLTQPSIDYVHGNAIEVDYDGNLLISSRNMDEITKIDRQTGDIIWRLGGLEAKNNQFQFTNDPITFSHQHDIRRLPNGNITLFDNGNLHTPPATRSLEYQLDEINKIAVLVWKYNNDPITFAPFRGSTRRLANNNTIIGWGHHFDPREVSEIKPDGTIALEVIFPDSLVNYRAFKFLWRTNLFVTNPDSIFFESVPVGDSATISVDLINNSADPVDITGYYNVNEDYVVENTVPFTLPAFGTVSLNIKFIPSEDGYFKDFLHIRSDTETSRIAQVMILAGRTDTIFSDVKKDEIIYNYVLEQNYPNPFNPSTIIRYSIPIQSKVNLTIYNSIGENIAEIIDLTQNAGSYEVEFDGSELSSGIYFYRLQVGSFIETKKMILLR